MSTAKRSKPKKKRKPISRTTLILANGTILIWVGIIMGITSWVISLFRPLTNATFTLEMVVVFLAMGGGVDILGIFDAVFKVRRSRCR